MSITMPPADILPFWNSNGVLPSIQLGMSGVSPYRSPYRITLSGFLDRFALSQERIKILIGFLAFRKELHKIGITQGFQWLDGSFLENIETLENRPPRDLDVVTFYKIPTGETQQSLLLKNQSIFNKTQLKNSFFIDAYFFTIGNPVDEKVVNIIAYWYGMWSHRRNGLWKGFVQMELDPTDDINAIKILEDRMGVNK